MCKGTLFQKVTLYKHQIVKSVAAIRIFVSVLYMQEDNNLNNRNSAFVCNLHTNFVLLQLRYYQQHGIEIFSDYLGQILDSDKL